MQERKRKRTLHWDTRRLAGETLVVEMTSAPGVVAFDEVTESYFDCFLFLALKQRMPDR